MAVLGTALVGCSGGASKPKAAEPATTPTQESTDPETTRVLQSGPSELETRRADGSLAFVIRSQSSRASISEGGKNQLFAQGIKGEFYDNGKIASRFTATEAKVDNVTKRVVLTGKVVLTSESRGVTMRSTRLEWEDKQRIAKSSGDVLVESKDWRLGRMKEVWATSDLSKVGSPERFK